MWIEGFIQTGFDETIYGKVRIVKDVRFYAGEYIGHMELVDGDDVTVKRHPCGTLNGSIVPRGIK